MGAVKEIEAAVTSLFALRLTRLEQVSIQLRHLHREYAACMVAEKQHKAQIYLNSDARSASEREGQASAHSVSLVAESMMLKGEITALSEERDFLRFTIEFDVGE